MSCSRGLARVSHATQKFSYPISARHEPRHRLTGYFGEAQKFMDFPYQLGKWNLYHTSRGSAPMHQLCLSTSYAGITLLDRKTLLTEDLTGDTRLDTCLWKRWRGLSGVCGEMTTCGSWGPGRIGVARVIRDSIDESHSTRCLILTPPAFAQSHLHLQNNRLGKDYCIWQEEDKYEEAYTHVSLCFFHNTRADLRKLIQRLRVIGQPTVLVSSLSTTTNYGMAC